jgi:hypothetical protein
VDVKTVFRFRLFFSVSTGTGSKSRGLNHELGIGRLGMRGTRGIRTRMARRGRGKSKKIELTRMSSGNMRGTSGRQRIMQVIRMRKRLDIWCTRAGKWLCKPAKRGKTRKRGTRRWNKIGKRAFTFDEMSACDNRITRFKWRGAGNLSLHMDRQNTEKQQVKPYEIEM